MKKILLLPLDERPCNSIFPNLLFSTKEFNVVSAPNLGYKKEAADFKVIEEFLLKESKDASGIVLSIDMLLYGGLVPGRIHNLDLDVLTSRLELVEKIKKANEKLKIFAFQCIMRCPTYNGDYEEPDYYKFYGEKIHKLGVLTDKERNYNSDDELKLQKQQLESEISSECLSDYLSRRKLNIELNVRALELVKSSVIDFLVIPQDDAAQYGFTAMDQRVVRKKILENSLQDKVLIYPGADEVSMILLSRMKNEIENKLPSVYILYASEMSKFLIPSFEDRPLVETLKYHILAAGCRLATCADRADLILAVNAPGEDMKSFIMQDEHLPQYETQRNMPAWINEIELLCKEGKAVSIADNAYSNAGELALVKILNKRNMLFNLAGYAGWNTSSNTVGTAIAQGVQYLYNGNDERHKNFLALRYIEDIGYCGCVRSDILVNHLEDLALENFDLKDKKDVVGELARIKLEQFVQEYLGSISDVVSIDKVDMPWNRMFEANIKAHITENKINYRTECKK